MDSESCYKSENEGDKQKETGDTIPDDRNVSKSIRIRRSAISVDQINRFLMECEFGYVLPCGILFWIIFLIFWN
jgi:hypothetical protein